jgi:hypothetical protein
MKTRNRLISACAVLITGAALATIAKEPGPSTQSRAVPSRRADPPAAGEVVRPPIEFSGGAPSIDGLIDNFLDAVERKDSDAMHRLRVTKDEYLLIIVPGTVDEGQPPRQISEEPREFFWKLTDRKSRYAADAIVDRFGGRHFAGHDLRFSKGTTRYLWYTVRGQVRLNLHLPDDPSAYELRTGSIAEVNGRYKFLAFNWND